MGGDVLLKRQSCLLRLHARFGRDSLKSLVFLFRRGADFPMQLLHGFGKRRRGRLIFRRQSGLFFAAHRSIIQGRGRSGSLLHLKLDDGLP
jgi:hypothetical protein